MNLDNGFKSFLAANKKIWKVGLVIALGVALILISSSTRTEAEKNSQVITLEEYKEKLEGELSSLCSDVKGVGKCKVFITFERGEQSTYKGSVVIESKPPKVLGVTVVCRGADSEYVKSELTAMITALFDIGSNRVAVLKLNS